jgi:hypothetical protein
MQVQVLSPAHTGTFNVSIQERLNVPFFVFWVPNFHHDLGTFALPGRFQCRRIEGAVPNAPNGRQKFFTGDNCHAPP